MNFSPTPKTPVRTPQPGNSNKTFQLTPIWQEVVKNQRLPPDVNENLVFKEISSRLEDPEWPVRQHAFRVLYDIIPIISKDRLDERIIQNDILVKLVMNLGHSAPGVRKVALETIRQYLKQSKYSEKMLENFITYGVKEEGGFETERTGIARENITLGTIISLVEILKPFIFPENGGYAISQQFLTKLIEILGNKLSHPLYQEKCLDTIWKIREMIGEARFARAVDRIPDKTIKEVLNYKETKKESVNLEDSGIDLKIRSAKKAEENNWSDEMKSENSYGDHTPENNDFHDSDPPYEMEVENSVTTYHNLQMLKNTNEPLTNWKDVEKGLKKDSSDDMSDGTDTDTYTKEPAPDDIDDVERFVQTTDKSEKNDGTSNPEIEETAETTEIPDESDKSPSPRVVLETEIQLSQEKAIKMTIVEDEKDSEVKDNEIDLFPADVSDSSESSGERRYVTEDGDLIMKILHDGEQPIPEEEDEERKRTPRRVRFGGEVIKLRTPDSDATDITIEIHEVDDSNLNNRPSTAHGRTDRKNVVTIYPREKPRVDRLVIPEVKGNQSSHIPIAISPVSKNSENSGRNRDVSPIKRSVVEGTKIPVVKENVIGLTAEGTESLNSSSSSEADLKNKLNLIEDNGFFWKWTEYGFVDNEVLKDLKNKNDWKTQYQALEQLKIILISPKTVERIKRSSDNAKLNSLLKFLLYKLPQENNQQITTLSVSIVSQLLQILPKEKIHRNVDDVIKGLCKYVGGCKNVNLKIESVQSLKMLFGILEPSSVIDVLLGEECLLSPSSKLRENSLLAVMYATMTFPSNLFNVEKILEKVSSTAVDSRRRVRHASLEAIAILSQFCSSETLTENIAKIAGTLPNQNAKAGLISAVQARLSRRVLPTVSNEGLVLYALQIPASRRIGSVGNPIGADVDWILSGTGSVSTGSARSRNQLNAAQRLDVSPSKSFSPTKWSSDRIIPSPNHFFNIEESRLGSSDRKNSSENPWTIQKNRTENSAAKENWKHGGNRFYKTQSTGNLANRKTGNVKFVSNENLAQSQTATNKNFKSRKGWENEKGIRINPEEVTWALVPVSTLEESQFGGGKGNALWGELEGGSQYFSSSFGPIRPLYLKLQPGHDSFSLSRSTDDLRRSSRVYGKQRIGEKFSDEEFSQIRVLTPSILRDRSKNDDLNSEVSSSSIKTPKGSESRNQNDNNARIPPLHPGSSKNGKRFTRQNDSNGLERKTLELEDSASIQRSIIANHHQSSANALTTPPAAVFLPNIHHSHYDQINDYKSATREKPPLQSRFSEIDEIKLQDTMTQLSGLLTTSKALSKSLPLTNRVGDIHPFQNGTTQSVESEIVTPIRSGNSIKRNDEFGSSMTIAGSQSNNKLFYRGFKKTNPNPNPVASAPAAIISDNRDPAPSTSSSNSTDVGLNGSEIKTSRLNDGSGALEFSSSMSYRNMNNSFNQKVKAKRAALAKNLNNKVACNGNPFPDNLKAFDRPKEGLDTCFNQLESQQWEVTMLGLTSLVRLLRHHPAIVLGQLHPIVAALGRQIRNLRSQVSRAACQASGEMFVTLKRNLETDLEELAGPLFHRSADTNRFIRADCNHALDNMTDNISPGRVVAVIIAKGASHQNATVRTVSARLLLRLSEKVGPERVLTLPKDIRDKMIQAGANLLMEGKLETRAFAKELFRVWSSHPGFSALMLEAIPPNVMRHISKTLISLKS